MYNQSKYPPTMVVTHTYLLIYNFRRLEKQQEWFSPIVATLFKNYEVNSKHKDTLNENDTENERKMKDYVTVHLHKSDYRLEFIYTDRQVNRRKDS